jgi:hypothetical protein
MPFDFSALMGKLAPQQNQQMWQNYQGMGVPQTMNRIPNMQPMMGGGIGPSMGALQGMMNPNMNQLQGFGGQFGPGAMNFSGGMPLFGAGFGGGGIRPSPSFNMMKPPRTMERK